MIYAIQPRRATRTRPSAYLFNPLRSRKDRLTFEGKFVRVSKTVSSVRWNVFPPFMALLNDEEGKAEIVSSKVLTEVLIVAVAADFNGSP